MVKTRPKTAITKKMTTEVIESSIALQFRFTAGRYHATPWDKQVNEGAVEWPPSPWRFLRALIAVWYQKGQDSIKEEELVKLLDKLSALPDYLLPPATVAHTRHYMPIGKLKDGKENTALVLDTFAAVGSKPVVMLWNGVDLTDRERQVLELLLAGICYFGRAESWAEAKILNTSELDNIKKNDSYSRAYPAEELPEGGNHELVKLLARMGSKEYAVWKAENAGKFGKLPESAFIALQAQTSDLKNDGWDRPPGSSWVHYARKKGALNVLPESRYRPPDKLPTLARFAVASAVRPNLKNALSLAERVHKSLVMRSNGEPVFTGCDANEEPLKGHQHARIFCESIDKQLDLRKTISHITVYAPMGFNENAELALRRIEKVWGYGGHDVRLMLLGIGGVEAFTDVPILKSRRQWKSMTPFVPTTHPKVTRAGKLKLDAENGLQIGSPKHNLLRLLKLEGRIPVRAECEPISDHALLGFTVERKTGSGRRCDNRGYSCLLEFNEPVEGPIAVGYGSHFGLGLFVPAAKEEK